MKQMKMFAVKTLELFYQRIENLRKHADCARYC
jgi:hypothetical protein